MNHLDNVDAIIFDCDGTLVDTEPLCEEAWAELLARWSYRPTTTDIAIGVGNTFTRYARFFQERIPNLPEPDRLHADYWSILRRLYIQQLRTIPATTSLFRLLQSAHIPVAIASNSDRERLNCALNVSGLDAPFVTTVAADEVSNPKPSPDLFLAAAGKLGADPARCIVIEDSARGVAAAKAAGMRVALASDSEALTVISTQISEVKRSGVLDD